jgi:phosphoglycolate phosphatase-like HAD superfamily hydrolase
MDDPLFIYVDVDDTLCRSETGEPMKEVIDHICDLHRQGAQLYCWSTGGQSHAREFAQKLGIEGCFAGFLHKPQIFIDDERADEWPHFVHVSPKKLGTMKEYRKAVEEKKDGED